MKKRTSDWALPVCFLLGIALLTAAFFLLPKKTFSEHEKRPLSAAPQFSFASLASGTLTENAQTYIADHFPLRETFVGLHAYWNQLLGQNGEGGVYRCKDGRLIAKQGTVDPAQERGNIEAIRDFAVQNALPVTWLLVPCAGAVLEDALPRVHAPFRDDELLNTAKAACGNDSFLDVRGVFAAASDVPLYYKTDHHLTSRGTLLLYDAYCRQKGLQPQTFSLTTTSDGFYGTAYSKSGLWLTAPDTLEIFAETDGDYTVTIRDGDAQTKSESLYFPDHLKNMDQYPVFLDGNHGLVKIKNNRCSNGTRLLLLKDSFAHCFATFLAANYEEVWMVDLRYYRASLGDLLKEARPQELLVLYGAENLATSTDIAWLSMQ